LEQYFSISLSLPLQKVLNAIGKKEKKKKNRKGRKNLQCLTKSFEDFRTSSQLTKMTCGSRLTIP